MNKIWERLDRKIIYKTKFLKVFSDKVKLPDDSIVEDYSVVKKLDAVIIVATTKENKLLLIKEYKYAINETTLSLPAGVLEENEDEIESAKRELLEETGYSAEEFTKIGTLYSYPSKDSHKLNVVRAIEAHRIQRPNHEQTEIIEEILLMDKEEVKIAIKNNDLKISEIIAALTLCGFT